MDGKGRWIDNVFIERLWRSVKYENIYLRAYETGTQLRRRLTEYFDFYNARRTHQALDWTMFTTVEHNAGWRHDRRDRRTIRRASAATRQPARRGND